MNYSWSQAWHTAVPSNRRLLLKVVFLSLLLGLLLPPHRSGWFPEAYVKPLEELPMNPMNPLNPVTSMNPTNPLNPVTSMNPRSPVNELPSRYH